MEFLVFVFDCKVRWRVSILLIVFCSVLFEFQPLFFVLDCKVIVHKCVVKVLELAGNAAHDKKKNRIIPRHVLLAVRIRL